MFNKITRINKSRTFTKHISCKCECKFDSKKCNLNQKFKSGISVTVNVQKIHWKFTKIICEKNCIWNPAACNCENGKYVGSIIDDSVVICDQIINTTKLFQQKALWQKQS